MSNSIRVIQYGLGAIGRAAARLALTRPGIKLVGAIDADPKLVGRDLGEVLGLEKPIQIPVRNDPVRMFGKERADAVIHCTGSRFDQVYEQLAQIGRAGLHCVTSCEEAMFPYYRHHDLAGSLDRLCVRRQVAMVGTGVNPGFVMDTLALVLTAVSQNVSGVRVLRIVNAGTRREALQRKVGASISQREFQQRVKQKKMGHVGLLESLMFLADGLGWKLDDASESIEPVLARKNYRTEFLAVPRGRVAGIRQIARGVRAGKEVLRLELQMYVGAQKPRDEIQIIGDPPLRLMIEGGTPGDVTTPAILVNTLPRLMEAEPGLHTMRTLRLPRIQS